MHQPPLHERDVPVDVSHVHRCWLDMNLKKEKMFHKCISVALNIPEWNTQVFPTLALAIPV